MITFKVRLANIVIEINSIYESTKSFCEDYLEIDESSVPTIRIQLTEDDLTNEAKNNDWLHKSLTIFQEGYEYLETLATYRKIATELIKYDILLIHGSVVSIDNEAYMFIAPSGTGKSTHTKLWMEHFGSRAKMINDDKPLIIIKDNKAYACGTPWSGKHDLNTNTIEELRGICFLTRNDTNSIEKLPIESSYEYALLQTFRPIDDELSLRTFDLLDKLLANIPFYKMGLNNFAHDALETSYKAMSGEHT